MKTLTPTIKRRLEIQGFTDVDHAVLEETAPWLRFAYGFCAILAAVGTGPLPKRGAPGRFACGLGTVWLLVTAWAFYSGFMLAGYILGALLVLVAGLVSTIHFCIPSLTYRLIFGLPSKTGEDEGMMCKTGILCHR